MKRILKQSLGFTCILLVSGGLLSGCDAKPKSSSGTIVSEQKYEKVKTLHGLVTNDDGPIKTGIIKALTESGQELSQTQLEGSSQYSLDVPAGTVLPIILGYYPTADASGNPLMISAVVHAGASKFDINQLSTRIAEQAKAYGGYTHKNLVRAAEESGTVPASNKTTAGFRGDPTTQYGGWH